MLSQHQSQRLEQRLTPQQILLSTLLQLPMISLEMRIKQEMEINPLIEETVEELESPQEIGEEESDDELSEKLEKEEEIDWDSIHLEEDSYQTKLPVDPNQEEFERQDELVYSLQEKLILQLDDLEFSENERKIAEYIIWNVKEDGYLDEMMKLETIAHIFDSDTESIEKILGIVQRLEPKGIGSRNLRECLMLQVEDSLNSIYLLAYDILKDAYDEFTGKKFEKIASIVGANLHEIKEALVLISKLNPKPGEAFVDQKINYIIPDFFVEKDDDKFIVTLNDSDTPNIRISQKYIDILKSNSKDRKTRSFIKQRLDSAKLFMNAIEQRKNTMLKVMNAIIEKQYDFFNKGPNNINPLIMKEIAEIIEMDISTVSRVVNGKYVQTEYGVYELKSFFSERMEMATGEEVSTKKVKEKIKELIDEENKQKPLSDELLSKKLKEYDYKVARRTVAKYREQLGMAVARLRREIK
jgi:RNA polymerase sigma-54 factor